MEYLFIYALQLFDNLEVLGWFSWLLALVTFVCFIVLGCITGFQYENFKADSYSDIREESAHCASKFMKKTLITTVVIGLLISFLPTKQTLLVMGGLFLGKKAVKTVITDEKIKKVDTIINLELDKRIKELKVN